MVYVVLSGILFTLWIRQNACMWCESIVEGLIRINRLQVHLERVHPFMNFGNDFRWREVLLHGHAVKCDVAPPKTIRNPKVLSPIFANPWTRKMRFPNLLPEVRSREIFPVSLSLNCSMGMSSPRAGRGQKYFQECPSESFSSSTAQ